MAHPGASRFRGGPTLNPLAASALAVIDMQNDFVRAGAPFEVASARRTIPVIRDLAAAFRRRGRPVIFTRYVADPLYRPLRERLPWIAALDPPVNACVPGFRRRYRDREGELEGVAVIDELTPEATDFVLDKVYFSAFHETPLAERLRALGVASLVVVGTVTEMCVEDTARHAVHFGLPTTIVSDAVSSNDAAGHRAALDGFARNYGWVLRAEEVMGGFADDPVLP